MSREYVSRRQLLKLMGLGAAGTTLAACQPKVAEKVVTKEVEKQVEKVVKETVEVEKEVTRVVEEAAPEETGPVVVRYHARTGAVEKPSGSEWPIHHDRVDEFMEEHPNIEVQLQEIPTGEAADYWAKLFSMIAAGTVGDMTWTSSSTEDHHRLAAVGALEPLEDLTESQNVDLDEFFPAAIGGASFEGHLYGLPFTIHSGGASILIFNKTLFEDEGLELLTDESEIEDVRLRALALTDADSGRYGFRPNVGGNQCQQTWMRNFGGQYISEDGRECLMNSPEGVAWAEWTHGLYQEDEVAPLEADLPSGGLYTMFAARKVASFQNGPWAINSTVLAVDEDFEMSMIPVPEGPGGVRGYGGFVNSWAMLQQAEHKPETFRVMHAMSDHRAGVLRWELRQGLAARPSVYEDPQFKDDDVAHLIYNTVQHCIEQRISWNFRIREMASVVTNELERLWLGQAEPSQTFMDSVVDKANEILAKERLR